MDGTGIGGGAAAGTRRLRGHVTLGPRMWGRIQREFMAGASTPWLSARYGAGERTIGARAKKEGWRRKDLAEAADAEMEAAETRGDVAPVAGTAIAAGLGLDGTARAAAAAFETALKTAGEETPAEAAREALDRAVASMRLGDAGAATAYVRLAGALEGLARAEGTEGRGDIEDGGGEAAGSERAAALAFLRREAARAFGPESSEPADG